MISGVALSLLCMSIFSSSDAVHTAGDQIRLVNGPNSCSGRVEVYHDGEWGTVCDDSWGRLDAQVVCRQVGCGSAQHAPHRAYFGPGRGRIWMDDVRCSGRESALTQCPHRFGRVNCHHGEDASVVCAAAVKIKLVNGPNSCSGRVEVYYHGKWGTVCDDYWDQPDAEVVCRQVGCGPAQRALHRAHYGRGRGQIWMDDVRCSGGEPNLSQCPHRFGTANCHHREDAGVVCAVALKIRLVNGPNSCSGRVEVYHNGEWGTVCDDHWDLPDAQVVCRQMGCGSAQRAPHRAHFGPARGHIWMDDVRCSGGESNLSQCPHRFGTANCHHGEDAGVVCAERKTT